MLWIESKKSIHSAGCKNVKHNKNIFPLLLIYQMAYYERQVV